MGQQTLDFGGAVANIASRVGSEASVVVSGHDPEGNGLVAELTGTLRAIGPDPEDPEWARRGPAVFGFEGQANAFYLDPDAFVSAWASAGLLHVQLTFGSLEVAGPIHRPAWF
jgi:hypothetical protein